MRSSILLRFSAAATLASSALLLPGTAQAWNPNARFCFRDVVNTPDTWLQPPVIDGVVSGDNGWTSAWRYVFDNSTYVHDAVAQGIKDANHLYLSFEVNNDTEFSADDAIVLAIDPTGAAGNRRLLHIFPVVPSGAAAPVPMLYWQSFPWSGGGMAPPAGTEVAVSTSGPAGNRSWSVELKLPRASFGIPGAGNFGMYFNLVPVKVDLAVEHPWPAGSPSMLLDLKNTPDVNDWGEGTAAAVTCNGVYITALDIRTDNSPPTKINLNAPNTFRATVHNTTIDGGGSYIPANQINATFRIANFGLPSVWQNVVATAPATNPTGTTNISANSTADLTTSWTLTAAEQATYASHLHQCILTELDTTAAAPPETTVFANKSAWRNMDFGTASKVEFRPEIDPRGWKRPPAGHREQRLELIVTRQVDPLQREDVLRWLSAAEATNRANIAAVAGQGRPVMIGSWASLKTLTYLPVEHNDNYKAFLAEIQKATAQVSQLTYLVHGCRRSGDYIDIHGTNYELCERVGSYGYILRHAGIGTSVWEEKLDGPPGLERVEGTDRYQMKIDADQPVRLRNEFVATSRPMGDNGGWCGALKMRLSGASGLALICLAMYLPRGRSRRKRNGVSRAQRSGA